MAIVEDDVMNESEEDNDIAIIVEEDDQDSGDEEEDEEILSDEDDAMDLKVAELEKRINDDPYNYEYHIELVNILQCLSDLDKWRDAFNRFRNVGALPSDVWKRKLQAEIPFAHLPEHKEALAELFLMSSLDCYCVSILMDWVSWAVNLNTLELVQEQLSEVLRRGGADPFHGKLFWDAKVQHEISMLELVKDHEPENKEQAKLVLNCYEEILVRPLLHGEEAWTAFEELALKLEDQEYINKIKEEHQLAQEFLQEITPYEDKLLTLDDVEERCAVYNDYIEKVLELSLVEKYSFCDINDIVKVLYDRATYECMSATGARALCLQYMEFVQEHSTRPTRERTLDACVRRCPRVISFWVLKMQQLEEAGVSTEQIKSVLETALEVGIESYRDCETVWTAYLLYLRRNTNMKDEAELDRLRRTFRLAWDTVGQAWTNEANDCSIPMFWARVEYNLVGDHKFGKELFGEMFTYGTNKDMWKYWELYIRLESAREPRPHANKLRDLHRRSAKNVLDYPHLACGRWIDFERDYGTLDSLREATMVTKKIIRDWEEDLHVKFLTKQKLKKKAYTQNNRNKTDKKKTTKEEQKTVNKGKRRLEGNPQDKSEVKRKKEKESEKKETGKKESGKEKAVELKEKKESLKRPHEANDTEDGSSESKRPLLESDKKECTLFVSNLAHVIDQEALRAKLSEFGEILSMRVRAGVKAFGGSICYCEYTSSKAVDEALKHDRCPFNGRPMFLSKYTEKKNTEESHFKYPTQAEKNKLFVRNLTYSSCTKEKLQEVFGKHGAVKDIRIVTHKNGSPKGLAYIEYEDQKGAAAALLHTDGVELEGRNIEVAFSAPPPRKTMMPLVVPKRRTVGMSRTQLSQFIPSVLQQPSTSGAAVSTNDASKPMSNSDFRNMLLKK